MNTNQQPHPSALTSLGIQLLVLRSDLPQAFRDLGAEVEHRGILHRCICLWCRDNRTSCYLYPIMDDRGPAHYHCHHCGAHGTILDLLMNRLHLTYEQAVVHLAHKANEWPDGITPQGFVRPAPDQDAAHA